MSLIGQSVRRVEDDRLVRGRGAYTDDFNQDGQAYLAVIRSPHAHARILAFDTAAARAAPGVLLVLTGADYAADGIGTPPAELPPLGPFTRVRDKGLVNPPNTILPLDRVRYVGEPVVIVVADTAAEAKSAGELVVVEYDPLDSVVDAERALAQDAPQIWSEAPSNLVGVLEIGDADACAQAFAAAAHVVSTELVNNRVIGSPLEPRGALGTCDPETGRLTLVTGTQMPNSIHHALADGVFHRPLDAIRVISPDMGGGFGTRASVFPEHVFVLWCADRLKRPVKWLGERVEAFLSDPHGRDSMWRASLALDRDGIILGLKVHTISNLGGYPGHAGALVPVSAGPRVQTGVYRVPSLHMHIDVVFTNTTNVAPYRGAGQPEAVYLIERLMDRAAKETGIDRVELRRRNLLANREFPYQSATGAVYDSGDYAAGMHMALKAADWDGFPSRRAQSERRGMLRGLGLANYVQVSGGRPDEWGEVRVDAGGTVEFRCGTHSHGQSHATTFAQVLADQLDLPFDAISIIEGDTDQVKIGGGTHGSRSLSKGGDIAVFCCTAVLQRAKRLVAMKFTSDPSLVDYDSGQLRVRGTNFTCSLFEAATYAKEAPDLPGDLQGGLAVEHHLVNYKSNFPSGTHICEVEIDPETGFCRLDRYVAVDDAGRAISPMVVEGQIHGGIAQGVGQALFERIVYDPQSGQLITASFMDYAMPRAADLPPLVSIVQEVSSPTNALGVKGIGESGATGAPPAIISAIADALSVFGIDHVEMPAHPERIWQAIQRARGAGRP